MSWILGGSSSPGYRRSKIRGKFKGDSFFKFVMSNRFNYRNSTKFIEDIIYSYDDLEGLLDYVPKKVQESKSLKEEIRILRLFRGNNKKFIIKVDRLKDGTIRYMSWNKPKTANDRPSLVLYNGEVEQQTKYGSGFDYRFQNGEYLYVIENNAETTSSKRLMLKLYKNYDEILYTSLTDLNKKK